MTRLAFTDFEAFVDALRGVQGRYLPTMRSTRDWKLRILDVGDVTVMSGQGGAGNIYHGVTLSEWVSIVAPLSRQDCIIVDGHPLARDVVAWLAAGCEFQFRALQPTRWLAVNLRRDLVQARLALRGDAHPRRFAHNRIVLAAHAPLVDLMSMVRRAFRVEDTTPDVLHASSAQSALREQLLACTLQCLDAVDDEGAREPGRPKVDRRRALEDALGIIRLGLHESVSAEDLSRAARVSPRTLQTIFLEHFAMTPHRYIGLRRLCAIRDALRASEPGETVQSVCSRYGVWDFGRFASRYRRHFGVLPSTDIGNRHRSPPVRDLRPIAKDAIIFSDDR